MNPSVEFGLVKRKLDLEQEIKDLTEQANIIQNQLRIIKIHQL